MTWALVPPMPKALTPAHAGCRWAGQGVARVLTWKGLAAKSICGLGTEKLMAGGSVRCLSAMIVLIRPVTPAAASRWPMLLLTEPMAHCWRGQSSPKAWVSAAISIGSPSTVPVPWVST